MTTAATTPGESRSRTASAIILGADAVLAAHPATAVQLAHACLQAGYSTVVPPSWGDELIATETVRQLRGDRGRPVVFCACPHVSSRLLDVGDDLVPFLVPLVAPPVAAALYLRELARDEPIEITFVGACPAGDDASIDAHHHPADFLTGLADRGISLAEQPAVFDSVLPPDRRRHRSLPGGVPTAEALWKEAGRRALVEITDTDPLTELAQHLASGEPALLDLGPALACTCSGAVANVPPRSARSAVCALEPPRSASEIVDQLPIVHLSRQLPTSAPRSSASPTLDAGGPAVAAIAEPVRAVPGAREDSTGVAASTVSTLPAHGADTSEPSARGTAPIGRKRAATSTVRAIGAAVPTTNSGEGRALPRAYVGRRQGRRRGGASSSQTASSEARQPAVPPAAAVSQGSDEPSDVSVGPAGQAASARGRLFAPVPIATTHRAQSAEHPVIARAPEAVGAAEHTLEAAGASPAVSAAAATETPPDSAGERARRLPRFEAPVAAVRTRAQHFARRSVERPLYLGILIAIVAVLSIALGMAAERALRNGPPVSADPTEHGARSDSVFGTSTSSPSAGDPGARAGQPAPNGDPDRRAFDDVPSTMPRAPERALRQSAAGTVAPGSAERPPTQSRRASPGGERPEAGSPAPGAQPRGVPADTARIATDSITRRDSARRDSITRDSTRRDSASRTGDSLSRPASAPLTGDSVFLRQRDELQRELADRQRRIDSLQRWLDSVRRTPPPPPLR